MWGNTAISTLNLLFVNRVGDSDRIRFLPHEGSIMEALDQNTSFVRNASNAIEADHYAPEFAVLKKLRCLGRNARVDLWAMDEVHFQQHGSRCRMWVPPEVDDPICLHAPTRKSISFFGAVRLQDGSW